jgi:predicted dinucleotide-binding enzyme
MKKRIGVLGSGDVAKALAKRLKSHGKEVRIGSRSAERLAQFGADAGIRTGTFADVAAAADIVILAVKGTAAEEALRHAGIERLDGKIVIDSGSIMTALPVELNAFKRAPGTLPLQSFHQRVAGGP